MSDIPDLEARYRRAGEYLPRPQLQRLRGRQEHGRRNRVFIGAAALVVLLAVTVIYIQGLVVKEEPAASTAPADLPSEICTASGINKFSGAPATLTVYNVGGYGKTAKTRLDVKSGSGSRKESEHIILRGLTAYSWKSNNSMGYTYPVAAIPYKEFLDIQHVKLTCKWWAPEKAVFAVPDNVKFISTTEECPTGCPEPARGDVNVPVFASPARGQALKYGGEYVFRVKPNSRARGFLWGFFQNGEMVWENYRDEKKLSNNEYRIVPGTEAHSRLVSGKVEVWVRAMVNDDWTDAAVITVYLR